MPFCKMTRVEIAAKPEKRDFNPILQQRRVALAGSVGRIETVDDTKDSVVLYYVSADAGIAWFYEDELTFKPTDGVAA